MRKAGIWALLYVSLAAPVLIGAQTTKAPSWPIISDYGPRKAVGSFHGGIDYDGNFGDDINPVEAGVISDIRDFRGGGGYGLEIQSGPRIWWYFHTFSNASFFTGNWERLEETFNVDGVTRTAKVVVLWANKENHWATQIWSACAYKGRKVELENNVNIKNATGTEDKLTECAVTLESQISPVGDSGEVEGPHLHVALNGGFDNPLLYLPHEGGMSVQILSPTPRQLFLPAQLNGPYPIQVRVNSMAGLDMDKLMFVVHGDGANQVLGPYTQPAFSYGGRLDAERFGGKKTDSVDKWVFPQDANPATPGYRDPGLDDFFYDFQLGNLNLSDGEYRLEAIAMDVNNNTYRTFQPFRIDKTPVIVHLESISPLYENFYGTGTINPSTLERAHTLSFEDSVAGISALVITGPAGFPGYSHVFDPPVSTTTLSFEEMPLGPYELRAVDAAGNETVAPFVIDKMKVEISTAASTQRFDMGLPGTYFVDLNVKAETSAGLGYVELRDEVTNDLIAKKIPDSPDSVVFPNVQVLSPPEVDGVGAAGKSYRLLAYDKSGNMGTINFALGERYAQIGGTPQIRLSGSSTYESDVFDVTTNHPDSPERAFLPGMMVQNYAGYRDESGAYIRQILYGLNGLYFGERNSNAQLPYGLGTINISLQSGDSPDLSDATELSLHSYTLSLGYYTDCPWNIKGDIYSPTNSHDEGICAREQVGPVKAKIGRYAKLIMRANITSGDVLVSDQAIQSIHGLDLKQTLASLADIYVLPGKDISVPLRSYLSLHFNDVSIAGTIHASIGTEFAPLANTALPLNTVFDMSSDILFDEAQLDINYPPGILAASQENLLKIYRVVDAIKGQYEELPSVVDAGKKKVSARISALGRFMLAAPAYATPNFVVAARAIGGKPELEFVSNAQTSGESISASSIYSMQMLKELSAANLLPVSGAYYIGPDDTALSPSGAITMRYDRAALAASGISENALGVYEFTADGTLAFRLPRQILNADKGELSAEVPKLYSLFAILASSYQAPSADIMMPETGVVFDGASYFPETGVVYVATTTKIILTAADWPDAAATGILASYYFKNRAPDFVCLKTGRDITKPSGTCENPVYDVDFTLTEGTHTIYYQSADRARNFEFVKSTAVFVDGTPPTAVLFAGTIAVSDGGSAFVTETDSITLSYLDPEVDLMASGPKVAYRLIDIPPSACESGTPPDACAAAEYAGPFTLSAGTHTVYYAAMDNVGNMCAAKSALINVKKPVQLNFSAVEKSATSIRWQWDLVEGATAYQVVSSAGGGEPLSGVLPATAAVYAQTGLMPNTLYTASLLAYAPGGLQRSALVSMATLASIPMAAESFLSGQNASVVLGQGSFYTYNYGSGPNQLAYPAGVAMDGAGNLWVADSYNHRVLRYPAPLTTGKSADLVIGQSSLYLGFSPSYMAADNLSSPRSITFDRNGRLWVADGRGRVLRFSPPFVTGMGADRVIGAANFTSWPSGSVSASRFCSNGSYQSTHVGSDASGNLWVSDTSCHRVLRFSEPFYNGMPANLVLGQQDFSSSAGTSQPNDRTFFGPYGVGFDLEDNIWVADRGNFRVLKFEQPYTDGKAAALVVGQPDFYSRNTTEWNTVTRNKLSYPNDVDFDGQGSLYVADDGNNRVLQFRPTFSDGMDADVVIGAPNFNTRVSGGGPATLSGGGTYIDASGFVYTDPHGRIWVSDRQHHRVLLFEPGGNSSFNDVGSSSFTLQWDSAFNSPHTVYLAEISRMPDFSYAVAASGEITSVSQAFTGLEVGARYYARVRAKNLDGIYTEYLNLGSIQLKPAPPVDVHGVAASSTSIIWSWTPALAGTYELFSSTGGILSEVLAAGTSWYLQAGLTSNTSYSCFIRITNESGVADSDVVSTLTDAAPPGLPQFIANGQAAEFVLGQTNFVSAVSGRSASAVGWIDHVVMDKSGNLWVTDESNCRVLRFDPPFSAGMNASLVIGPPDFTSSGCFAARNRLNRPRATAVDNEGRLWVSDAGANRVLMFNPPFSNGMDADLVIGQTDFTSYLRSSEPYGLTPAGLVVDKEGSLWVADSYNSRVLQFSPPFYNGMPAAGSVGYYAASPNSGSLRNPEGVAIDSEGSLWVVDTGNNRVMEFVPPFSAGMPASVIIGRFTSYVRPDTMATPRGLAFDSDGNLYVADGYARVLAYKKPFSMYMNASVVLGQNDLYSFERGLSAVLMTASPYGVTAGGDGRVWVADRNNRRALGFKRSPFTDITQHSLLASWGVGANPSGTLYRLELASSTDYTDAIATEWAEASSSTIPSLLPGTKYYGRVMAKNFAGVPSEPLELGEVETLPVPPVYSRSEALMGGKPEVSLASLSQMSAGLVDGGTSGVQVAIGSAVLQGLITVSPIYNIGPEGTYDPPAMMSFYYSSSAVAAIGVPESELAVYEYFAGTGWVRLDGQVLDTFNKRISVPLTHIASLFGIFVKAEDWAPPITEFVVTGSSYAVAAELYIGTGAVISLNASDPVVYGTSSGVAFTEFRVDATSSAPFTGYSEPIVLSTGAHSVEFRSGDNAGNIENGRFLAVIVDGEAPTVSYAIVGSSFSIEGRGYAAPGSTVALAAADARAGTKTLAYEFNGSTYSVAAGSVNIQLSEGGEYNIRYSAEDNVGNAASQGDILVWVDTAAPSSQLQLNGSPEIAEWYTSAVVAGIEVADTGSGVQKTLYSLDGTNFSVYAATFSVLAEGRHGVEFYSVDNVLNAENTRSVHFGIDLSTPEVTYSLAPAPNADGWNNAPVDVVFTGTDAISGIAQCSSSFTVTGEGTGIPVSGYCADYAGWTLTTAFVLNIDTTPPLSQAGLAASAGLNGWLVSTAVVQLVSTDSLSGLKNLYYSLDGSSFTLYSSSFAVVGEGGHLLKYFAVDKAGNTEDNKILEFRLDLAAPSVEAVSSPAANNLGWNNTAVTTVFSGADAVSGLAYCEPEKFLAAEGSSRTISGYCMDHAGWSSTATTVVNIDTTVPGVAYSAIPAANEAGWNNTDVTLKFSCEDARSGIKTCPADIVLAMEGAEISVSTSAQDNADNSTVVAASVVKIDKTAPVSSATIVGALVNGWYSSSVKAVLASTDALAGIKAIMYSLDGAEYSAYALPLRIADEGEHDLRYYAVDNAGNAEDERSIGVKIDSSLPDINYSQTPLGNDKGWNNSIVQVVFSGSDTLSGVEACSSATVTLEGAAQSVSGWCRDIAGNVTYATATVSIDLTSPEASAVAKPSANEYGWNNGAVEVAFAGSDVLSGLARCESPKVISVEGSSIAVSGYCLDNAGNSSTTTLAVSIDTTVPNVGYSVLPPANEAGWNNTAVRVVFGGSDTLSGVDACSSVLLPGEGAAQAAAGYCSDLAGNIAYATATINIDMTPAAITISSPLAGQTFIATRGKIGIDFTVTDNLDPAPAVVAFLVQLEDRGGPRGTRAAKIAVTDGQAIEPLDIDDGVWKLTVNATDFADNPTLASGGAFEVIHDVLAPESELAVPGTHYESGGTIYLKRDTALNLNSLDDLVVAADKIGLGVKKQVVNVDAEGLTSQGTVFENRLPKQGEPFVSTFTLSSAWTLPDGRYSLGYAAEDVLGNVGSVLRSSIALDDTAPEVFAALAGTAGENNWYTSTVTVNLSAADALSGLAGIFYRLDGAAGDAFGEYTAAFGVSAEGEHTVWFYAKDNLGNTGAPVGRTFKIDRTAPAVSRSITPAANTDGWHNATVKVDFSGTDAMSGISYCEQAKTIRLEGRDIEVAGYCRDHAGLSSTSTARFNIDLTSPTAHMVRAPLANTNGWNNSDVTASYVCGDALSGVKLCPPNVVFTSEGAGHGTNGTAFDYADNWSSVAISGINIDKTSPVSSLSVSGDMWAAAGNTYLSQRSRIVLSAADPVSGGTASGIEGVDHQVDPGTFQVYVSTFGLSEGVRTVHYRARDNAGNIEAAKSAEFLVDNTAPVSGLSVSGGQYNGGKQYISPRTDIIITAADPVVNMVASGVRETKYAVDGGAAGAYAVFTLSAEGKRMVAFYSADQVANVEVAKTSELWVDATAPVTALAIAGVRHDAGDQIYITKDSSIALTSADPVSNETASGVLLTKYRVDGGDWQVYAGGITIPAEGPHTLDYYSIDNVQNAETQKSLDLVVDNSAPTSALDIGEPRYEVFGLRLITPDTPVSVTAADTGGSGVKAIYYELSDQTGWTSGALPYTEPFRAGRPGTFTVLYWAVDNAGNLGAVQEARLRVSAMQNDALDAVYGLDISGTADIAGTVRSNTVVSIGGNARILGDVWSSTITLSGKAQITGQQHNGIATLVPAPLDLTDIVQLASATNNNHLIASKYLPGGRLVVGAKEAILLSTGVYYFKGIDLGGGASISLSGKVDILVAGDVSLSGGALFNAAGSGSGLNLFLSTVASLSVTGGGSLVAYVYAPYAQMKLTGNALLGGHYFVGSAAISGSGNVIQSGETLPQTSATTGDSGTKKKVSAFAAGAYSVLSGPDPEFKLGEVYVFPNPAKGGDAPVFHVETGIADSVRITIYTVSGRQGHEATLNGMPAELDDGNGLSYAYEYTWRGHIPSGVYYYHIEAEKSGRKLKKSGKFAVVR